MSGGSPSFLRSVMTVTRTTLVNGSAFSSQTFSRSSSLESDGSAGREQRLEHPELLVGQVELASLRQARRLAGSSSTSP